MKKTIEDYNLDGKKVIIRCDLNVPMKDNIINDDTRIKASLKTIKYALDNGASVIILSHLGKVKEESDKKKNDLYPVSIRLSELLNINVKFSNDTRSDKLTNMASNLKKGEVLLIQNTRYEDLSGKLESGCDLELAKYWASLGDVFINDAYGTLHRSHASNVGISKYLPNGIGFLVQEEITKIDSIINDNLKPFIVIMGGAKVSDKIKVIENLITKCDKLLIGGAMAYTFINAKGYNVGTSLCEKESIDFCKNILNKYENKIILPIDTITSKSIDSNVSETKNIDSLDNDDIGLDIGPQTIKLFLENIKEAKRVVINGPMGMFEKENYQKGTAEIYNYLANNNIKTLVGGGDSVSAVNKLSDASKFYHISTGGGATLEYLEGKILPGIATINEKI